MNLIKHPGGDISESVEGLDFQSPIRIVGDGVTVKNCRFGFESPPDLERENAMLREELWDQWEANHFEHCSREWPHPEGYRCCWPLPDIFYVERRTEGTGE